MSIQSEAITVVALTRSGRPAYFRTVDIMMIPNCMDLGVLQICLQAIRLLRTLLFSTYLAYFPKARLGYKKTLLPGLKTICGFLSPFPSLSKAYLLDSRHCFALLHESFCVPE